LREKGAEVNWQKQMKSYVNQEDRWKLKTIFLSC